MKDKILLCKYYDVIVNYGFDDNDKLSSNLLYGYIDYIEKCNIDLEDINKMLELDYIVNEYVIDYKFNNYLHTIYNSEEISLEYLNDSYNKYNMNLLIKTNCGKWY